LSVSIKVPRNQNIVKRYIKIFGPSGTCLPVANVPVCSFQAGVLTGGARRARLPLRAFAPFKSRLLKK